MLLEFDKVEKSFPTSEGPVPVLRGISFDLATGQTLALTGESGSGKSTLLHVAAGLEGFDGGTVKVAGQPLGQLDDAARAALRRNDIALVFQQFNLIPSLSVAANIAFQARLAGRDDADHIATVSAALGLSDYLAKYPETLSGGQQQRVAIARALAAKPKLLLADEPTGNLDEGTAEEVLEQMLDLVTQTGAGLMLVTHSPAIAARMQRRLHLKNGLLA
ncbi:ABC transporter ATP-binding protein [Sulfitobacter geojensis]|uniref:ABC transporter ATP-binding protein n=1 Tax=Sulfitobacter geojensis TaxID=1342299 RepID=UPI00046AC677|nr:ABC transporter ATP-binding protein [Sulfitobacter geojensis]KHA51800.1 Lipoprotein-releasing system ATP-binding protein LolD [Sulfitobacter geojensis]NYI29210.1 putative ABC transport system ATP-binding protein [Sulfitobacter geojensis]